VGVHIPNLKLFSTITDYLNIILTYLPTYLLTPWSRVHPEKLSFNPVNKFSEFYGTRRFITAFITSRHLSLSWASSIHFTPTHRTSWRPILILSFNLRLDLPSGFFLSGFLTKTLYTPLLFHIRATCLAHLILLDFITRTMLRKEYWSLSSSLALPLNSIQQIRYSAVKLYVLGA
jgi:hypothetical protein